MTALFAFDRGLLCGLRRLPGGEALLAHLPHELAVRMRPLLSAAAPEGDAAASGATGLPAVPEGLDRVHVSWIESALAEAAPAVLVAIAEGAPEPVHGAALARAGDQRPPPSARLRAQAPALRWALLGPLADPVPLPALAPLVQTLGLSGDGQGLSPGDWLEAFERLGALLLGTSLAGSAPRAITQAMLAIGDRHARTLAQASARPVERPRRAEAQVLVAQAASLPAADPRQRLAIIGALVVHERMGIGRNPGGASWWPAFTVARWLPLAVGRPLLHGPSGALGRALETR